MRAEASHYKSELLASSRPIRVLLVEDDANDEYLTLRAIREANLPAHVQVAKDGAEAAQYLFGEDGFGGDLPELVILDAKLPKITGHELLQIIRGCERSRRLPVVMLSSSCDQDDVRRAYDCGANCFLQKPIDLDEYTKLIQVSVQFWLCAVRLPSRDLF
jgi:two-component system response regulator